MGESMSEGRKRGRGALFPIGVMLALAGVCGAAAAWYLKKLPSSDAMNMLEPSPEHLDFGEVWEDAQFSMVLPITNHRGQDLEIKQFLKTCNCSQIEPPSLSIPAWQTREVRLILDLTPKKPEEFAASVRDFEVGLSPEVPGETHSVWWTIRGRVRSVMQSNMPKIDFGNISELSRSKPVQKATLTTRSSIQKVTASCSSPHFEVTVARRSSGNTNQFDLVVAMKEMAKRGEIRCSISAVPELGDGERLPPRRIEVLGRIVRDIEFSPPGVFFGGCPVGTSKTETVTLRSLTGQLFEVSVMRYEGDGLSVERRGSARGGGFAFEVKQKADWSGEHSGKVIFRIARSGGKEEEIMVPVSYCGF